MTGENPPIEQRARTLRAHLAWTLDELDRRRHAIFDLKGQARRHAGALALAGAGAGLLLLGSGALAWLRVRQQRRRRWQERAHALGRWWRHPEQVALTPSVPQDIGRRVIAGLVSSVAVAVGKRLIEDVLRPAGPAPRPVPRPSAGLV